jgi:hypothetical protein
MDATDGAEKLISRTVVPMFREPDLLSEQVSQGLLGMRVGETRVGEAATPEWRWIRTPDGYGGWAAAESLAAPPPGWKGPWGEIEDLWAHLRPAPEYRRAAALLAPIGARLPIVQEADGWIGLLAPDGRLLWTEAHRVRPVEREPLRPAVPRAVCRTARRFLGVPYLWGGCSPLGLDCSGFVQLVMRLHGVQLLRDAHQQATQGGHSHAPEGADLVFFATGQDPGRISHVGMTLDRERFIHAAGSDRVRVNRLADEPYRSQLLCARRFLG